VGGGDLSLGGLGVKRQHRLIKDRTRGEKNPMGRKKVRGGNKYTKKKTCYYELNKSKGEKKKNCRGNCFRERGEGAEKGGERKKGGESGLRS